LEIFGLNVAGYGRSGPEKSWTLPSLVYGYGNFAIGLDPKFFQKLHIQAASNSFKLLTSISNPNLKPPTQFHISQNIW